MQKSVIVPWGLTSLRTENEDGTFRYKTLAEVAQEELAKHQVLEQLMIEEENK